MVARVKSERQLLVTLTHGDDVAQQIAANPADAARRAVLMIASAGELDAGDKLDVTDV